MRYNLIIRDTYLVFIRLKHKDTIIWPINFETIFNYRIRVLLTIIYDNAIIFVEQVTKNFLRLFNEVAPFIFYVFFFFELGHCLIAKERPYLVV